jgi:hypothetical protein
MSFTPQKLEGRTYTLCGKKFQSYSIKGFSFEEPLNTTGGKGIYSFTKCKAKVEDVVKDGNSWMKCNHSLIYLGKSNDFDDRPHNHDKFSEIGKYKPDYLALYTCKENEYPKTVESEILAQYFFEVNKKENEEIGNRETTVVED